MDKGGIILIRGYYYALLQFTAHRRQSKPSFFIYYRVKTPGYRYFTTIKKSPCQSDIDRGTLMG